MASASYGIRQAKSHLSKLLKIVQNGNEVVLTDRGRAVGKIVPVQPQDLTLSARIKKLEEKGVVAPEKKSNVKLPSPVPVPDNVAQSFLEKDREDG